LGRLLADWLIACWLSGYRHQLAPCLGREAGLAAKPSGWQGCFEYLEVGGMTPLSHLLQKQLPAGIDGCGL
jgi:hypothetical protein